MPNVYFYDPALSVSRFYCQPGQHSLLYMNAEAFSIATLKAGNLALYVNGQFFAPVVDCATGIYGSGGGAMAFSAGVGSPYALGQPLACLFLNGLPSSPGPINSIEFRPYQWSGSVNGMYRIYSTGGIVKDRVINNQIGSTMFVDGQTVGKISKVGTMPYKLSGYGPFNWINYTGNSSGPTQPLYWLEFSPIYETVQSQVIIQPVPTVPTAPEPVIVTPQYVAYDAFPVPAQPEQPTVPHIPVTAPSRVDGIAGDLGPAYYLQGVLYLYDGQSVGTAQVKQRLVINDVFVGIISDISVLADGITAISTIGHDLVVAGRLPVSVLHDIYGVWKVETFDNIGRAPLLTACQISLCDYSAFPYLDTTGTVYSALYPFDPEAIQFCPADLNVMSDTGALINGMATMVNANETVQDISLPVWVEKAAVNPEQSTYTLAGVPDTDMEIPIMLKVVTKLSALAQAAGSNAAMFRTLWQKGRLLGVDRESVSVRATQSDSFCVWQTPGQLKDMVAAWDPSSVGDRWRFFALAQSPHLKYHGPFDADTCYALNSVVTFNGNYYQKTDAWGEIFVGTFYESLPYTAGQVVLTPSGYQKFDGTSWSPYVGTSPDLGWQLLNNCGAFDATEVYSIYDLVVDYATDQLFVASQDAPASVVPGTGWLYLMSVFQTAQRATLVTASLVQIVQPPTNMELTMSLMERFSPAASAELASGSLLERVNPNVVDPANDFSNGAYQLCGGSYVESFTLKTRVSGSLVELCALGMEVTADLNKKLYPKEV